MAHENQEAKGDRLKSDLKKVQVKVALEEESAKTELYEINEAYTKERHRWGTHVQEWGDRVHHGTQPKAMAYGQTPQEWRNPSSHDQNHHHSQNRMHAHNLDSDKHYNPDGLHYTDHPHGALPNMQSTAHDSYKTGDIHTATMHAPAQHADPGTAKKLQGNVPVGAHDAMMHYHPQQGAHDSHPHQALSQSVGIAQHPDAFFAEHSWMSQSKTDAATMQGMSKQVEGGHMHPGMHGGMHGGMNGAIAAGVTHHPMGQSAGQGWGMGSMVGAAHGGHTHPHHAAHHGNFQHHGSSGHNEFGAAKGAWNMQQGTQQSGAHSSHNEHSQKGHASFTTHPAHAGAVYHQQQQPQPYSAGQQSWGAPPGPWGQAGSTSQWGASMPPPQAWGQQSTTSTQAAPQQFSASATPTDWGQQSQASDFSKHTLMDLRDELLKLDRTRA